MIISSLLTVNNTNMHKQTITYIPVNDHVRVAIIDDGEGCIEYRLESKVFGQWYRKNFIEEFYNDN